MCRLHGLARPPNGASSIRPERRAFNASHIFTGSCKIENKRSSEAVQSVQVGHAQHFFDMRSSDRRSGQDGHNKSFRSKCLLRTHTYASGAIRSPQSGVSGFSIDIQHSVHQTTFAWTLAGEPATILRRIFAAPTWYVLEQIQSGI